ncbi:hypothetical protein QE450_001425 [Paenibacillus sp. SORGH_AS306]|nr:hypothetical protein [Paenibacillus sp. SORGH_AS_0306]MDR6110972.1 hypothetical protein [Paenibacillus sp. SORGH_AS_0338]
MNNVVKERWYAVLGIAIVFGGIFVIKAFSGDL